MTSGTREAVMHPDDECRPESITQANLEAMMELPIFSTEVVASVTEALDAAVERECQPLQPGDAVRAAADTVLGRFGCNRADCRDCAEYVFAAIPADATAAITAEWLREWRECELVDPTEDYPDECYAFSIDSDIYINVEPCSPPRVYLHDAGHERVASELPHITTRHQFTQLAACLGIQPQPPKEKE